MCDICGYTYCHSSCPNRARVVIGECALCGSEIEQDYECHRDGEGNLFCDLECALEYYSIQEMEM